MCSGAKGVLSAERRSHLSMLTVFDVVRLNRRRCRCRSSHAREGNTREPVDDPLHWVHVRQHRRRSRSTWCHVVAVWIDSCHWGMRMNASSIGRGFGVLRLLPGMRTSSVERS